MSSAAAYTHDHRLHVPELLVVIFVDEVEQMLLPLEIVQRYLVNAIKDGLKPLLTANNTSPMEKLRRSILYN